MLLPSSVQHGILDFALLHSCFHSCAAIGGDPIAISAVASHCSCDSVLKSKKTVPGNVFLNFGKPIINCGGVGCGVEGFEEGAEAGGGGVTAGRKLRVCALIVEVLGVVCELWGVGAELRVWQGRE